MKGIVNPFGVRNPQPPTSIQQPTITYLNRFFAGKTLDQLLHSSQWALSCFQEAPHISEIISDTPRRGVCIYIYIYIYMYIHIYIYISKACECAITCKKYAEIHPGKLTWQWKNNNLKMYLLKRVMFHWHVGFRRGYHYLPCIWDCHQTYNLHNSTNHLWLLLGTPNCLNQNVSDFKHSNKVF